MSMRPTKKSDLGKHWLQSRGSRQPQIKLQPEYHLIVTEGTKTEPNYCETIRDEINREYKGRINLVIEGTGFNTVSLVQRVQKIVYDSPNSFKHVWVVYDKDDFTSEQFNRAKEICEESSTEDTIYHAIWSNQCIELWFLLHFCYYQSDTHRDEYYPKLTKYLKEIGAGEYR